MEIIRNIIFYNGGFLFIEYFFENLIQIDMRFEHELDTVTRSMEPDCDLNYENFYFLIIWPR